MNLHRIRPGLAHSSAAKAGADDPHEVYAIMATEVTTAIDRITSGLIERVHAEITARPQKRAEIAANLLRLRHELHDAASGILDTSLSEREQRIERVRLALGIGLRIAAAFLVDLVDHPGQTRCGIGGAERSPQSARRAAVYASHIRSALHVHGMERALITVRSEGYQISPRDARRIRALWGDM